MQESPLQKAVFSIMMVCVMVYGMICYNIALEMGGLSNETFLAAFHELVFMGPIALILETVLVSPIASRKSADMVGENPSAPFARIAAMSALTVWLMCPLMSLVATLLIKQPAPSRLVATWIQTTALNLPMALLWQFFFAGPVVRSVARAIFGLGRERVACGELD